MGPWECVTEDASGPVGERGVVKPSNVIRDTANHHTAAFQDERGPFVVRVHARRVRGLSPHVEFMHAQSER